MCALSSLLFKMALQEAKSKAVNGNNADMPKSSLKKTGKVNQIIP